jgi:hypothetical protein
MSALFDAMNDVAVQIFREHVAACPECQHIFSTCDFGRQMMAKIGFLRRIEVGLSSQSDFPVFSIGFHSQENNGKESR